MFDCIVRNRKNCAERTDKPTKYEWVDRRRSKDGKTNHANRNSAGLEKHSDSDVEPNDKRRPSNPVRP